MKSRKIFILLLLASVIIAILSKRVESEVGIKLGELSKEDIAENRKLEAIENADIINVRVADIGDTYAVLEWETDKESTINIRFGERIPGDRNLIEMIKKRKHSAFLDRLEPAVTYYFSIKGKEEYRGQFKTTGSPYPKLLSADLSVTKTGSEIVMIFNKAVKGNLIWSNANFPEKTNNIECSNYADFHKFTLTGLNPSNVYCFSFEGEDEAGKNIITDKNHFTTMENNIALGQKVEGTFTVKLSDMEGAGDSQSILNRIVDNSTNYFKGIATSGNISETDQWIVLDLGEVNKLKLIIANWRKLCYPTDYSIEISMDKREWKLVKSNIDAVSGFQQPSDTGDPMFTVMTSCAGCEARYIRINCKTGKFKVKHRDWTFVQLNEIKVFPE